LEDTVVAESELKELTVKQMEDGLRRYLKLVEDSKAEGTDVAKMVLLFYWKRGQRVASLMSEPKKYGNKTAENFGRDIRPDNPYNHFEVRRWHRFYKTYTLDEVEEAAKKELPWRSVVELMAVEDKDRRLELQQQVTSGKISSDDLRSVIKKETLEKRAVAARSGTKTERRGGASISTIYRTFLGFTNDFAIKIDEFIETCRRHDKAPEGGETALSDTRRRECAKALRKLAVKFDRAVKASEVKESKEVKEAKEAKEPD